VAPTPIERVLARALPVLAVAWAVLVLLAPWLGSSAAGGRAGAWLSAVAYGLGGLVCHQRPERSFHLAGAQLPVCARCTGLYVSGALGVVFAWWRDPSTGSARTSSWRAPLVLATLPTLVTLVVEWWWPAATSKAVRAIAALPAGAVAGLLLAEFSGFRSRLNGCEPTRRSD
jgi:uncharacterized membrane protein